MAIYKCLIGEWWFIKHLEGIAFNQEGLSFTRKTLLNDLILIPEENDGFRQLKRLIRHGFMFPLIDGLL